MKTKTKQKPFTFLEILIVIGIVAVLMGIVLVAINPSRHPSPTNYMMQY